MIEKDLLEQEQELKDKMSQLLIKIREANGIKNPFIVSREMNQSTATLRNIEKGISFPTNKTLKEINEFYMLTIAEKRELKSLKKQMLEVRKQIKESRK